MDKIYMRGSQKVNCTSLYFFPKRDILVKVVGNTGKLLFPTAVACFPLGRKG